MHTLPKPAGNKPREAGDFPTTCQMLAAVATGRPTDSPEQPAAGRLSRGRAFSGRVFSVGLVGLALAGCDEPCRDFPVLGGWGPTAHHHCWSGQTLTVEQGIPVCRCQVEGGAK